jgi:hypothetical protein
MQSLFCTADWGVSVSLVVCQRSDTNELLCEKIAKDLVGFSPRYASGVARARGKQDACAPSLDKLKLEFPRRRFSCNFLMVEYTMEAIILLSVVFARTCYN